MNRSLIVLFALVSLSGASFAQDVAKSPVDYKTALTACAGEWKAFKKQHSAGGREQWNMFRADCVTRQGYVAGKGSAQRISNEEFAKLLGK